MNSRITRTPRRRPRSHYNDRIRKSLRKPIPRSVVPSFFTLMNLFCGFIAIVVICDGQLQLGALLILMAAVFDVLDGFMARLANATSDFGIELDSLSDVVSFGVAPGFLIYSFAFNQLSILGMVLSALPALCGAVRLARFNVEAREDHSQETFRGLPIPAQAMILVAFVLLFQSGDVNPFEHLRNGINSVLIPVVILLSGLMVTTIPFDKLPRVKRPVSKEQRYVIMLFLLYAVLIVLFRHYGLLIAFSIFIARGLWKGGIKYWNYLNADE